jgi:hypothetical protein
MRSRGFLVLAGGQLQGMAHQRAARLAAGEGGLGSEAIKGSCVIGLEAQQHPHRSRLLLPDSSGEGLGGVTHRVSVRDAIRVPSLQRIRSAQQQHPPLGQKPAVARDLLQGQLRAE